MCVRVFEKRESEREREIVNNMYMFLYTNQLNQTFSAADKADRQTLFLP